MSIIVNENNEITTLIIEERHGKDFKYEDFTEEQLDALKVAPEGAIATGDIKLDNPSGKIYGEVTQLTGDLVVDVTDSVIGGGAVIYHNDTVTPIIGIPKTYNKAVTDMYVINVINTITIVKTGINTISIVYNQPNYTLADTESPSVPLNLTASNITDNSLDLLWDVSTDNVGVTNYKVYQDGVEIANPANNSYLVTGLTAETTYNFEVTALDAEENESPKSTILNVSTTQASTLLLDVYSDSGNGAAYSLRKLRGGYSGAAIKVRRSNDNTEQDIGFLNDKLNETELINFVGSNDGYVTIWYDQSGNNQDVSQTNTTLQPKIVSSGTINTNNGNPSIVFNASRLIRPSSASYFAFLHKEARHQLFNVCKHTTGLGSFFGTNGGSLDGAGVFSYNTQSDIFEYGVANTSSANSPGKYSGSIDANPSPQTFITYDVNLSNSTVSDRILIYKDGVLQPKTNSASGSTSTQSANYDFEIGGLGNNSFTLTGEHQELILFNSDKSNDLINIINEIKTFYNIT
jgi:hypothetical protein